MEQAAHLQALSKAKIKLMARPDSVFFTTLCFSLKHRFSDEVSTAATDGREVLYNIDFFMSLSTEEQVFLLLHETLHCAYLHMERLKGIPEGNHRKWNIAADHVINLQLIARGFQMPKNGLVDTQYMGMGTEEVYKLLPDDPKAPCDMDLKPGKGDPDALAEEMKDILVRASLQSKMANDKPGTIPGDIEIFLDRLLNPKLPWNRILMRYMQSFSKIEHSFRKPNRRYFPDHILPSLYSTSLMDLVIAVDTSGSVSDADFLCFISEVNTILKNLRPSKITLIQFDTKIKSVNVVRSPSELMNMKFTGRGGTDVTEVIEWANEHRPQLLLMFTDGGFRFRGASTKQPLIWLIHNNPNFTAPYGKVIHYEI
jgi:predicted metal-dependent peptidase